MSMHGLTQSLIRSLNMRMCSFTHSPSHTAGRLKKYKDYLERTVDQQYDQSYEEVLDLLNRHKVLVDLYRDRKQFDLE
eukprot:16675-Eustigmatos_ZCMA.PRE.1